MNESEQGAHTNRNAALRTRTFAAGGQHLPVNSVHLGRTLELHFPTQRYGSEREATQTQGEL